MGYNLIGICVIFKYQFSVVTIKLLIMWWV